MEQLSSVFSRGDPGGRPGSLLALLLERDRHALSAPSNWFLSCCALGRDYHQFYRSPPGSGRSSANIYVPPERACLAPDAARARDLAGGESRPIVDPVCAISQ